MREKLIKLLNEGHFCWQMGTGYDTWEECVADHLLANGVIVLPCKVGDTVYRIVDRGYLKDTCETDCYSCDIICPYEGREYERVIEIEPWEMVSVGAIANAMENIGKTVFLTREQAEAALKEGE